MLYDIEGRYIARVKDAGYQLQLLRQKPARIELYSFLNQFARKVEKHKLLPQ